MHKIYFQKQQIKEFIWERYINSYRSMNWPSNDIDTFCWRLVTSLTFLKQDDEKIMQCDLKFKKFKK